MEAVTVKETIPTQIEALKPITQIPWRRLGLTMDGLDTGMGDMSLKEKPPPQGYKERRRAKHKTTAALYPHKHRNSKAATRDTSLSPTPIALPTQPHVEHMSNQTLERSNCLLPNKPTLPKSENWAAHLSQRLTNGDAQDSWMQAGKPVVSLPTGAKDAGTFQRGRVFIPYEPTKSVPQFRKMPPWRIDKAHRFSSSQALQVPRAATAVPPTRGRLAGSPPPTATYNLRSLTTEARHLPASIEKTKTNSASPFKSPKPLPVPKPEKAYLALASRRANCLQHPQRLLLVLDLNGTLLYRKVGSSSYIPRPLLPQFLSYCLSNHRVLVWSSATPFNVSAICAHLFTPEQRKNLLGQWARDTFGLTPAQYAQKTQVYKRLDRIWANETLQHTHHWFDVGGRWGQHNTLLLDDSVLKASAQPHNLVQMPEFTRSGDKKTDFDVLGQVTSYLEEARMWDNVSSFVKNSRFEANKGWNWDWSEMRNPGASIAELDEEDGGVKI